MDRSTRLELENLLRGYRDAIEEIEHARDDGERVAGWRRIQTLGWRLHELLPSAIESLPA